MVRVKVDVGVGVIAGVRTTKPLTAIRLAMKNDEILLTMTSKKLNIFIFVAYIFRFRRDQVNNHIPENNQNKQCGNEGIKQVEKKQQRLNFHEKHVE
mgnify:CR=1 FL=1